MDRQNKWLLIIIFIGLIVFSIGSYFKIKDVYEHRKYIGVKAKLVNTESYYSSSGESKFKLTYTYTVDNKTYTYETKSSLKIGNSTRIKYNPYNPSDTYKKSFDGFSFMQLLGLFFAMIPSVMLFFKILWLRDVFLVTFSGSMIYIILSGGIQTILILSFIIVILSAFFVLGLIDLKTCINKVDFNPKADILREIEITKEIKRRKREAKMFISEKQKLRKKKRLKKIFIGLFLFLVPLPSIIAFAVNIGFPNDTLYVVFAIIGGVCMMTGFGLTGASLMEESGPTHTETISVMGKDVVVPGINSIEEIEENKINNEEKHEIISK